MYKPTPKNKPAAKSNVSIKLAPEIIDWIDEQAAKEGVPRSTWLSSVLTTTYRNRVQKPPAKS